MSKMQEITILQQKRAAETEAHLRQGIQKLNTYHKLDVLGIRKLDQQISQQQTESDSAKNKLELKVN